jgi:hypothetical protein
VIEGAADERQEGLVQVSRQRHAGLVLGIGVRGDPECARNIGLTQSGGLAQRPRPRAEGFVERPLGQPVEQPLQRRPERLFRLGRAAVARAP